MIYPVAYSSQGTLRAAGIVFVARGGNHIFCGAIWLAPLSRLLRRSGALAELSPLVR